MDLKYKICTDCKEQVDSSLFTPKNAKCKPCLNKRWKEWYANNKEKAASLKKIWADKNVDKRRINKRNWERERKANDYLYKLKCNIRSLMWRTFKSKSFVKKSKTLDMLGCDYNFFKEYIESQFTGEMSWNNIHLDHIKPISSAKTEKEVLELNHYTNFQPLLAIDNIVKSDKLIEKQLRLL